ncbi:MAG: response regulator [Chloroflexi bacterium]|nr:MAG: response regulator [Chloroflexota bacterium]
MSSGEPEGQIDDAGRLAAIAAASAAFSDAVPDMEALLAIVAEQISRTTGDFCSVVLLSRDGRQIEPVAAFHPDPAVLQDAAQRLGVPMELDAAGPWKTVLTERRPVVIDIDPDHLPANMAPHQARHISKWRIRQAAMIPMVAGDRVVGGLNLNRMEGSAPLGEDDLKLLESLATRAARAIAIAQLMREQRMTASELETNVAERTRELSATSQFLDSMIENIPNMIFVKDAKELRFVRINHAGEELLGFSRDELMGKNDFDFFPADQAELFVAADRATLRNRRLVDIPEETIQTRNKGARTLHTQKIPILDAAGEPSFLLGISEDITEARIVQEALLQAQAEAERANKAKSQFLASMSHELRTPLNAILGFSELLSDDTSDKFDKGTRRRFLDQIHTSGQHLLQLINDILDLSKVEAGQMELHLQSVELGELVQEVRASIEPLARSKAIVLNTESSRELSLIADSAKVKQMLLNLVSNAIKFTPSGGRIDIRVRRLESWVEIAVSDSGIGIAKEDLGRLFAEFQQLDAGPGRQQEGTGLGLALTKRFAELHGGQVIVESELGKGSTFTLRLPLQTPAPRVSRVPASVAPLHVASIDLDRPLVLVVDDNPQAAEILSRHLEAGGFRTEVARTGSEALSMAGELKPVAITLDILLPEVDGWEVMSRLKADPATRDIPVVVVSVVDKPLLGRALGAFDYFVKPVDGKALLSRLSRYTFTTKVKSEPVQVLVVDDEKANLDMLEALLKPAGFGVLKAGSGQEGIDMARSEMPSLILLDLMMPGLSGFDVVEALRGEEATRSIPIMVLTAKTLTEDDKRALNGQVAAIFQRNSMAGAELTGWLQGIVAHRRN